jgi:hypothetical protein
MASRWLFLKVSGTLTFTEEAEGSLTFDVFFCGDS